MEEVVRIKLPHPHKGQITVLQSKARFRVLLCGRRWGKSLISRYSCITRMVKGQDCAYITPQLKLSRHFFKEFLRKVPKSLIASANKSDLIIELNEDGGGGTLQFFSGENLGALRGNNFDFIVIDEAAFIPNLQEGWEEEISSTIMDTGGRVLFISTPRGKGYFHELYLKGLEPSFTEFESFHYTSYDNPYLKRSEIELQKKLKTEAKFRQENLAVPGENRDSVISSANIEKGTLKTLSKLPTVCFGIDVSAGKHDKNVIIGLDKFGHMTYFDEWITEDYSITYAKLKALPAKTIKYLDSTGIGDVIKYEIVNTHKVQNVKSFVFTNETKSKVIVRMITNIEQDVLKFNDLVANQLSIFEYHYSASGAMIYGNKPGSGNYDDRVIALALAEYARTTNANYIQGNDLIGSKYVFPD